MACLFFPKRMSIPKTEQSGGWKGVRKGYLKFLRQGVGNLGGLLAVGLEPHLQRLWLGAETELFSVASGNIEGKMQIWHGFNNHSKLEFIFSTPGHMMS